MQPVRKADNLPPSCAVVTKSGKRNFLEPSGPVQACNGTALSLRVRRSTCFRRFSVHNQELKTAHTAQAIVRPIPDAVCAVLSS